MLAEIARSVGLDMARFEKGITDRRLLDRLSEDHTFAEGELGIFGTPTLVLGQSQVIFLKLATPPPPEECLDVFTELRHLAARRRYIQEIKRP